MSEIKKMERYPPLVKNVLPSLIREDYNEDPSSTQRYLIPFALSPYDSQLINNSELRVQIGLRNQKTNSFVFNKRIHTAGFKIGKFGSFPNPTDDYKYYVSIFYTDLQGNNFELNEFYKLQLRFMKKPSNDEDPEHIDNEYYIQPISEWSEVCLIKVIDQPTVSIHGLNQDTLNVFSSSSLDLIGSVIFQENEKEYLRSYKIQLFEQGRLVLKTDDVFTNQYNPNEFFYNLGYQLKPDVLYKLKFIYTTSGFYSGFSEYNFSIYKTKIGRLKADIFAQPDNINGVIKVIIKAKSTERLIGNITIRRSSSKDNFQRQEDIQNLVHTGQKEDNIEWMDFTAESGIWYKYSAQLRGHNGQRGALIEMSAPVICDFEDMFLIQDKTSLNIKFDPSVSSFKYNTTESQQNTLGSKYPYFIRNGNNYYRSFSIGGLITSMVDNSQYLEENIIPFTSKREIFSNSYPFYDSYNKENNIEPFNDFIYEKHFRDKVYDFLYKNGVKLFKSATQGNILIRLMDISFQPNSTLGRRIYSFSATAIEIDEATIENYDKYQVQKIGEYSKNSISFSYTVLGQIPLKEITANDGQGEGHAIRLINRKYNSWGSHSGYRAQVEKLKWVRFEFTSPPIALKESTETVGGQQKNIAIIASGTDATMAGYVIKINGEELVIPSTIERDSNGNIKNVGSFEIGDNIDIESVVLKYPAQGTLDYIAEITESEIEGASILDNSSIVPSYTLGQLYQSFLPNDSIIKIISDKYEVRNQALIAVLNVKIQAPQGTVIYMKDSKDESLNYHILQNGYLQINDEDVFIEDLYLFGLHFYEHPQKDIISLIKNNEYFMVDGTYTNCNNIQYPIQNGVYYIPSNSSSLENEEIKIYSNGVQEIFDGHYIYYNKKWYKFSKNHNIVYDNAGVPLSIDGIIDYCCQIY